MTFHEKKREQENADVLLRMVATIVNPTSENIPPRAIFLRRLILMPQRSQTGKPMTCNVQVSLAAKVWV